MGAGALWPLLGLVAGIAVAIQAPVNAGLARGIGLPVAATAVSFVVGAIVLSLTTLVWSTSQGIVLNWRAPALWMFLAGGCLGAFYVTSATILTPKIGATATIAFVMSGQFLAGIVMDRIGFLGIPVHEISMGRVGGVFLLLAGAVLIRVS